MVDLKPIRCALVVGYTLAMSVAQASTPLTERIVQVKNSWGRLGVNSSVVAPDGTTTQLQIGDRKYATGLGHQANGEIVIDLPGSAEAFEAEIGVQWQGTPTTASVVFHVYVDGKEQFRSDVMTDKSKPKKIHIALKQARQLRLVVSDAGDGIAYDCGDWADAKLVLNANQEYEEEMRMHPPERIDMALFGKLVAWNPDYVQGTKARRFELPSKEDLYPYRELRRSDSGIFEVPISQAGVSTFGLAWNTRQYINVASIAFKTDADVPPVENVSLQVWEGASLWQGKWLDISQPIERVSNRLQCQLGPLMIQDGTEKIRWKITNVEEPLQIVSISALNQQPSAIADLRVASLLPAAQPCTIEVSNGFFVDEKKNKTRKLTWDRHKPLSQSVQFNFPTAHKGDRTVLVFDVPEASFGVAVEDVMSEQAVYVSHAGAFVTRADSPITYEEYSSAHSNRPTVLERVRQRPDQTFQQALDQVHLPGADQGPMLVSLANDNRKFIAHRNGMISFQLGNQPDDVDYPLPSVFQVGWHDPADLDCFQLQPLFANGEEGQLSRHLMGGWLPAPQIAVDCGNVQYRQTTFVAPLDKESPQTAPHWQRLRAICVNDFEIENNGSTAAAVSLKLRLMKNAKNDLKANWQLVERGAVVSHEGRLVAYLKLPESFSLDLNIVDGEAVATGQLNPGKVEACSVYIPAWSLPADEYSTLRETNDWFALLTDYWNEVLKGSIEIQLPDELLTDVIKASRVHIMLAARNEKAGSLVDAWAGADRYGVLDSESHAVLHGMSLMGHQDFARRGLAQISGLFKPTGELTSGYTLEGTGEHLSTVAEYFGLYGDTGYAEEHLDELLRACNWIAESRKLTKQYDQDGKRLPEYGLMPPGVSADWARFAFRFYNDANYCAGLRGAGKLFAQLRHPQAKAIQKEAEEYADDIITAYRWTQSHSPVVALSNGAWVPHYPSMLHTFGPVKDFFPGEDDNRSFCYDVELGAHHLVANGILPAEGPDVDWIMNHMEDVQFLLSGFGAYPERENRENWFNRGGFGKLQPFYARVEDTYALHDDVKPFIRAYFNSLCSLLNTENLSIWEHFNHIAAWNKTHETGWFLAQTRTMLVMERGDDLWLAPFVTDQWTKDGMTLAVRNAPTRFGAVDYGIESHIAEGFIKATIVPPTRRAPHHIVLRVRHPEGSRMQGVLVNGKEHDDFDPSFDTITLRPADHPLEIVVKY